MLWISDVLKNKDFVMFYGVDLPTWNSTRIVVPFGPSCWITSSDPTSLCFTAFGFLLTKYQKWNLCGKTALMADN